MHGSELIVPALQMKIHGENFMQNLWNSGIATLATNRSAQFLARNILYRCNRNIKCQGLNLPPLNVSYYVKYTKVWRVHALLNQTLHTNSNTVEIATAWLQSTTCMCSYVHNHTHHTTIKAYLFRRSTSIMHA